MAVAELVRIVREKVAFAASRHAIDTVLDNVATNKSSNFSTNSPPSSTAASYSMQLDEIFG